MIAGLDTLLTALCVELTGRIIPSLGLGRRGPGRPPEVTDAELACLAVAQVLLRFDDERHWLRAAARLVGHLFPRLLGQSEYNDRVKALAPLMEAALRWLADHTPGSAGLLRLMGATPVPCGQSVITARRSNLAGYAGYGYCPSHSRWYWQRRLRSHVLVLAPRPGQAVGGPGAGQGAQARRAAATAREFQRPPSQAVVAGALPPRL
jgi:hypothetical protein